MKLLLVALAFSISATVWADTIICNVGLMTVNHANVETGVDCDTQSMTINLKNGVGIANEQFQNGKYGFFVSVSDPGNGDGTFMFQGSLVQTDGTKILGGMMELSTPQSKDSGPEVRAIIADSDTLNRIPNKSSILAGNPIQPIWLNSLPNGTAVATQFDCSRYSNL